MAAAPSNARTVYLITYSQVIESIVPDRETFSQVVTEAFEQTGSTHNVIEKWCCSEEKHSDGNTHYHMAVKLRIQRRWLSVRNYLDTKHEVKV